MWLELYIVANRISKEIEEISGTYCSGDPSDFIILDNIINRNGGIFDEYSVFHFNDESVNAKRILNSDEFELIWDENDVIGLDFSKEDNKSVIEFEFDKNEIIGDGVDYLTYSGRILKNGQVDTSINEIVDIPVISPTEGPHTFPIEVINGEASGKFTTTDWGFWNIIYKPRVGRFKVKHRIELYVSKPE